LWFRVDEIHLIQFRRIFNFENPKLDQICQFFHRVHCFARPPLPSVYGLEPALSCAPCSKWQKVERAPRFADFQAETLRQASTLRLQCLAAPLGHATSGRCSRPALPLSWRESGICGFHPLNRAVQHVPGFRGFPCTSRFYSSTTLIPPRLPAETSQLLNATCNSHRWQFGWYQARLRFVA
jgi:hypothetical protein